jgi:hypothetical protein
MHTTKDSQTFIHVESSLKNKNGYLVQGWIASERGTITSFSTESSNLEYRFTRSREDVLEFYPNAVDSKEFIVQLPDAKIEIIANFEDGLGILIGNLYAGIIRTSGFMNHKNKDVIVVDDFYADPDAVREFAMNNLEFQPSNYHKGERATQRFILDGTKEKLEEIMGLKITNWNHGGYANGIFQFCTADQPIVYHVDQQMYAAMVYLTPDAPPQTGTAMYRSKVNGIRKFPGQESRMGQEYVDVFKGLSNEMNFYDGTQFEKVDEVGNVYNRLVIFNSSQLHAATEYFGDAIDNARFFHMFFFDVEQ